MMLGDEEAHHHLDPDVALRLGKRTKEDAGGGLGADPVAQRQRLTAVEHVSRFLHFKCMCRGLEEQWQVAADMYCVTVSRIGYIVSS